MTELEQLRTISHKIEGCLAASKKTAAMFESDEGSASKDACYRELKDQEKQLQKVLIELHAAMNQTVDYQLCEPEAKGQSLEQALIAIREATEAFQHSTKNSADHLRKVADNSARWISESLKSLKVDELKQITLSHTQTVETVTESAVKKVKNLIRWFKWERLGIAMIIAVSVSLLTGLFINDESPWDSHREVVAEREAGKMLFKAWPKLSTTEKQDIQNTATQYL